jgi:hypothetical protein
MTTPTINTIQSRLVALLAQMLDESKIAAMYHPVINNMVKGYLSRADDSQVREMLLKIRDEIIPWLLGE